MRRALLVSLGLPFAVASVAAQTATFATAPLLPQTGKLVYDSRRNVAVVIETDRMWDWDSVRFRQRLGQTQYSSWGVGRAAFDPHRAEIHLPLTTGIATWNGARWFVTPTPTGWSLASTLAFDAARRRLVRPFTTLPDVAEWDGTSWTRVTPPASPGDGGQLVFDPTRGRCVLANGDPVALWSWDGTAWSLVDANGPATNGRPYVQLTHDPAGNRLVLTMSPPYATWAYAAGSWTAIPTPPEFTWGTESLAYDGVGLLRVGALVAFPEGLWRLEGNLWRKLPIEGPRTRDVPCGASSPTTQQIVMFGGFLTANSLLDDTWMFDGTWHRQTPAQSPPPRYDAGLAWSAADQNFVLFGGRGVQNQYLADTWTWNGTTWTQRSAAIAPPPRSMHAMAGDPSGGVLLFGGLAAGNPISDHWRWLGGAWQYLGAGPASGYGVGYLQACHDPVRNQTVLVVPGLATPSQSFVWTGTAWTLPTLMPFQWSAPWVGLAWRPETQAVACTDLASGRSHVAEWNGSQWTSVAITPISTSPPFHPLLHVTDWRNQRVVSLQHGHGTTESRNDLAVLTTTPAGAARFGTGCATGPTPGLTAVVRPRPGTASFAIEAMTFAPNAPTVFAIGFAQQPLQLGFGCVVWIAQPPAIGFLGADAAGWARLPLPLPADNTLRGVELLAQAAAIDPPHSPIGSITLSEGLRIAIGD